MPPGLLEEAAIRLANDLMHLSIREGLLGQVQRPHTRDVGVRLNAANLHPKLRLSSEKFERRMELCEPLASIANLPDGTRASHAIDRKEYCNACYRSRILVVRSQVRSKFLARRWPVHRTLGRLNGPQVTASKTQPLG
jgi:hypothetical protein